MLYRSSCHAVGHVGNGFSHVFHLGLSSPLGAMGVWGLVGLLVCLFVCFFVFVAPTVKQLCRAKLTKRLITVERDANSEGLIMETSLKGAVHKVELTIITMVTTTTTTLMITLMMMMMMMMITKIIATTKQSNSSNNNI